MLELSTQVAVLAAFLTFFAAMLRFGARPTAVGLVGVIAAAQALR